ncbi:MAG: MFS transporter [Tepidiformaceae bacterium]
MLAIEFLDELVFGAREAAWPLIRDDLDLSYAQIGLLIGAPNITSAFIEPALGILGDTGWRRALIAWGGVAFAAALFAFTAAPGFVVLLGASLLLYPASGAFVSLSQVALIGADPTRAERLMARWTLAGSVGVVLGPIMLGLFVLTGAGWRGAFAFAAAIALVLAGLSARHSGPPGAEPEKVSFREGLRGAGVAVRRATVWRWLVLLGFSDLMIDVLLGFLALYFVDVAGSGLRTAGLAVIIWSVAGLAGDALLVPLLERVRGLGYLRWSARLTLLLFPAFLLVPSLGGKLGLLALIGLLNAGWYAILKAQLYGVLPGRAGTAMAIYSASSSVTGMAPVALGLAAQQWGLEATMWLLLAGPVALTMGLHRAGGPQFEVAE